MWQVIYTEVIYEYASTEAPVYVVYTPRTLNVLFTLWKNKWTNRILYCKQLYDQTNLNWIILVTVMKHSKKRKQVRASIKKKVSAVKHCKRSSITRNASFINGHGDYKINVKHAERGSQGNVGEYLSIVTSKHVTNVIGS